MRTVRPIRIALAAIAGVVVGGLLVAQFLDASEPNDLLKVDSSWHGTCDQANPKLSYPMILFVKQRNGNTFEGTTWYPTLGNALLKVTGQIDAKGELSFTEDELIHAENQIPIVADTKYTAKLEKAAIKGSGEWGDPAVNGTTLAFSLELAE